MNLNEFRDAIDTTLHQALECKEISMIDIIGELEISKISMCVMAYELGKKKYDLSKQKE